MIARGLYWLRWMRWTFVRIGLFRCPNCWSRMKSAGEAGECPRCGPIKWMDAPE